MASGVQRVAAISVPSKATKGAFPTGLFEIRRLEVVRRLRGRGGGELEIYVCMCVLWGLYLELPRQVFHELWR